MKKNRKEIPRLDPAYSFVDTHCHLDMDRYSDDLESVIQSAYRHGIKSIVTIGIDIASSRRAVELARHYSSIYATVGIHPHDTAHIEASHFDQIIHLINNERALISGYGEIGLDYVKNYAPRDKQIFCFKEQLQIAKNCQLPVIIHDRDAHEDTLAILREMAPFPQGGILHCFSGDMAYADKILDLGFHISIPGIVTFKSAPEMKEVAASIPLNKLLLETDGPFLAPSPYRGKRNEPLFLLYTAEEVARLRDISLEQLASATTENATALFSFNKPVSC